MTGFTQNLLKVREKSYFRRIIQTMTPWLIADIVGYEKERGLISSIFAACLTNVASTGSFLASGTRSGKHSPYQSWEDGV